MQIPAVVRQVCVRTAEHADDDHLLTLVVNSVEHAVRAAACAIAVLQWWSELLARAVRIVEQWTDGGGRKNSARIGPASSRS